jgi:hypothetical protein
MDLINTRSRYASVGIAMGYRLGGQVSILDRGKEFISFSIASRPAVRPTQPPIQWIPEALSPR